MFHVISFMTNDVNYLKRFPILQKLILCFSPNTNLHFLTYKILFEALENVKINSLLSVGEVGLQKFRRCMTDAIGM